MLKWQHIKGLQRLIEMGVIKVERISYSEVFLEHENELCHLSEKA